VIAADVNLSQTPITADRTCAEAPAYSVVALSPSEATLNAAPPEGCLEAGDEVLLINLQGIASATENVGNWELLSIASVSGVTVQFTSPKTRAYGATAGSDDGIGPSGQKVALVRVPHFDALTIAAGATVTASAWNGQTGGVLAVRAGKLVVEGTVSAVGIGYRPGQWSDDGPNLCSQSVTTEAGESITGPGADTTDSNLGGSGGISAGSDPFGDGTPSTPLGSTPGHSLAGEAGTNGQDRTIGAPGQAYGAGDGTKLTMGSGPGGGLTCNPSAEGPVLIPISVWVNRGGYPNPDQYQAGGIIVLLADKLEIAPSGLVTARPIDAYRDVAFAGGYVFARGTSFSVGDTRIVAMGGTAAGSGAAAGMTRTASPGYIVLDAPNVSGTTNPPANWLAHDQ